jgi:hypothetical protein
LLPATDMSTSLRIFLESEGHTESQVLPKLDYQRQRSGDPQKQSPDAKRYRDPRQVYQTAGLLYEDAAGRIRVTEFGQAVLRWTAIITPKNSVIIARHAAYALSACQLRNPSDFGMKFDPSMAVFPFQFIWRAMLLLNGRISSDELNRGILRVRDEVQLGEAIERIAKARTTGDLDSIGDEVAQDKPGAKRKAKNDRIIPWMSLASFGWTLFQSKHGGSEYYELDPRTQDIIKEASRIRRKHREFSSVQDYVEYISRCAALPKDVR